MYEPFHLFDFVINGFHVFGKKFFFERKQVLHNLAFFFCFLFVMKLLLIFINERPHNTLSVFDEGAIEHILGTKVWF